MHDDTNEIEALDANDIDAVIDRAQRGAAYVGNTEPINDLVAMSSGFWDQYGAVVVGFGLLAAVLTIWRLWRSHRDMGRYS